MKLLIVFLALALALLAGCGGDDAQVPHADPQPPPEPPRLEAVEWSIPFASVIWARVRDRLTGREYLCIQGGACIELQPVPREVPR